MSKFFRFDDFCEQWAQCYSPISHKPGKDGRGKRFFRHDTMDERTSLVQSLASISSVNLLMSVITAYQGSLTKLNDKASEANFIAWRRHVIFWARQFQGNKSSVQIDTEDAAADAKSLAVESATDFISFMLNVKDAHNKPFYMPELEGLQSDTIEIVTLPKAFNGWWAAAINFDHIEPRPKCIIDAKYDKDIVGYLFPNIKL